MPVILDPDTFEPWFAANTEPTTIKAMLKPHAAPLAANFHHLLGR